MRVSAEQEPIFKKALAAADAFVAVDDQGKTQLLAGIDSLDGILLKTRRFAEAKSVLAAFAARPNRQDEDNLQFVEAAYKYFKATGDKSFTDKVNAIVSNYKGYKYGLSLESQALAYNALLIADEFNGNKANLESAEKYQTNILAVIARGATNFAPLQALWQDGTFLVRPSALLLACLSHNGALLPEAMQAGLVKAIDSQKFSPAGLLGPDNSVHPGLMGMYALAKERVLSRDPKVNFEQVQQIVNTFSNYLSAELMARGTMCEAYSTGSPIAGKGEFANAGSVAAMMEMLSISMTKREPTAKEVEDEAATPAFEQIVKVLSAG